MKNSFFLLFLICLSTSMLGQSTKTTKQGSVTFMSSQNVYVAFGNTQGISPGDTLFAVVNGVEKPVLLVRELSASSCMCVLLGSEKLSDSMAILAKISPVPQESPPLATPKELEASKAVNQEVLNTLTNPGKEANPNPLFYGKISVTSYSNFSDRSNNQRFRYNLQLKAGDKDSSRFTFESYLSFTHKTDDRQGASSALKIYSLAGNYRVGKGSILSFGRKINVNMANVGAVDGLQYEYTHKNMKYGILAGSRPDYYDYSFNPDLAQVGAFIGHTLQNEKGSMQTSLAVFNQMNQFKTDRRFAYLQHSNTLLKNLSLFWSMELDFYTLQNLQPKSGLDLTSTYISIRYRPVQDLSLSLSYDARKNIYYIETFRNQVDSLLDRETRQGYRFQFYSRPAKYLIWGGSAGYRHQKSDINPALNANSYVTYTKLPLLGISGTVEGNYFKTNYLNGMVYGASLSSDLAKGNMFAELKYRCVTYDYTTLPTTLTQNIVQFGLSWRLTKKFTLSTDLESTWEPNENYFRAYINLSQRF